MTVEAGRAHDSRVDPSDALRRIEQNRERIWGRHRSWRDVVEVVLLVAAAWLAGVVSTMGWLQ